MNERHFAKLVNKSPYYFWKMKEKEHDDLIHDEQGNIWVDEFGCTHSTNHKFKTYYRTYVGEGELQATKLQKRYTSAGIMFTFSLADDSKIKMHIFRRTGDVKLSFAKYISYREFMSICKWGLFVNPDDVRKWEQTQYKIIKELQVKNKLLELENDFK